MCDCECNKTCKVDEYLNCSCKKRLVDKLVLACEDEILNTTENLLNEKKVTSEKNICFIQTTSLIIICLLLLVVISISCYSYYANYRSKQKHLLPFPNKELILII